MILKELNWLAVAVSALAYFMQGMIWFNPNVFGKAWMEGHKMSAPTDEDKKRMPMIMIMTLIMCLISVICLAYFIQVLSGYTVNWRWYSGAKIGLICGCGFSAISVAMSHMYTKKSMMVTVVDSLFHVCGLVISGIILSVWH